MFYTELPQPEEKIIYGCAIGVGFLYGLFGYRLLRLVTALMSILVGGLFTYGVCIQVGEVEEDTSLIIAASVGGAIAIGCLLFHKVAAFAVGAWGMISIASYTTYIVLYTFNPDHVETIELVTCAAGAIVGGLMTLVVTKPLVVMISSYTGALWMVMGAGYFIGEFPMPPEVMELLESDEKIPTEWIIYAMAISLCTIVFIIMQFGYTALHVHHGRKKTPPPQAQQPKKPASSSQQQAQVAKKTPTATAVPASGKSSAGRSSFKKAKTPDQIV